jgi:hydroxymethylbilane synthase
MPAVGQGPCIECRKGDTAVLERIHGMDHPETHLCVRAERAVMKRLEGGCQVPIGAYAAIVQGVLEIEGLVASVDGGRMVREKKRAGMDKPEEVW